LDVFPALPDENASWEEWLAWRRDVFAPWAARWHERERDRSQNGRKTGRDRRLDEVRQVWAAEFAAWVAKQETLRRSG
jgi:hypothetical protein